VDGLFENAVALRDRWPWTAKIDSLPQLPIQWGRLDGAICTGE
jgi:hypothetical protein